MQPFAKIEHGLVITFNKGIYRQVALYERNGNLFAQHGSGFVKLYPEGRTGIPSMAWKDIDSDVFKFVKEPFGLRITGPKKRLQVAE